MKQIEEMQQAVDYLEAHWPKGHKERGEAMCLLALGQIGGREEMRYLIHQDKVRSIPPSHQHDSPGTPSVGMVSAAAQGEPDDLNSKEKKNDGQ